MGAQMYLFMHGSHGWGVLCGETETIEGQGASSQVAELKDIQLDLDITQQEKWPVLPLCIGAWMVANVLWEGLDRWRKTSRQRRGKPSGLLNCGKLSPPGWGSWL